MDDSMTNNSNSSLTTGTESMEPTLLRTPASFISASLICLLIIAALVANIFVCLAVYKQHSARRITRYFIINLCIADIFITVISMPVWLIFLLYDGKSAAYLLGEAFVKIWSHVDILCGTASIVSLTTISIDRYIAVTRPYFFETFMTTKRAMHIIAGIWMYSMTVALLSIPWKKSKYDGGYALFVMCASFLLPLFIIITAYGSMFRVARRHLRAQIYMPSTINHHSYKAFKRDFKAAKTVAVVIGTFLCCWAPFIFVSVCFKFCESVDPDGASVAKWLSYLNAVLNPVVYTCVDKQLRRLVWKRLSFCLRGKVWSPSKDKRSAQKTRTEYSPSISMA